MIKALFIVALLFVSSINLEFSVNNYFNLLSVDEEGNLFCVNQKTISKYSNSGEKLYEYSNLEKGDISVLDVNNRHYILVFYKEFNEIVFLDETLSSISNDVNLNELDFFDVDMVCSSYNKGFWLFDNYSQSLYRIDRFLKRNIEVTALNDIIAGSVSIIKMQESSDYLVLMSEQSVLYIFDRLGGYITNFKEEDLVDFNIIKSDLFYISKGKLKKYNLKTHSETNLLNVSNDVSQFTINSKSIALLDSAGIKYFSLYN